MKEKNILIFVLFFPIFFQIFAYYGFQSSYYDYKSEENPTEWYYKGIYGYRLLSREAVDALTMLLRQIMEYDFPLKSYIIAKGTTYYHALFLYNTFFAVLVSLMINKIFTIKSFFTNFDVKSRLILVFCLAAISGFSQYVIVHYDNSAIFLMLLGMFYTLKYHATSKNNYLLILSAIIFISTLNRETSCLNISFLAALILDKYPKTGKDLLKTLKVLSLPIICFLLPYFILRLMIDQQSTDEYYFFESITLKYNLTGINQITGWLYAIVVIAFIYFFAISKKNKELMNRFLIISIPYILMVFLVGILWETRLFVPMFYGLAILAFYNYKSIVKQ